MCTMCCVTSGLEPISSHRLGRRRGQKTIRREWALKMYEIQHSIARALKAQTRLARYTGNLSTEVKIGARSGRDTGRHPNFN